MILPSDMDVRSPLIHIVESDDLYLEAQEDVFWFDLLRELDWPSLRPVAARYYEALWQFNEQQAKTRAEQSATTAVVNPETPEEATHRLLFDRPTLCDDAPSLAGRNVCVAGAYPGIQSRFRHQQAHLPGSDAGDEELAVGAV